MDNQELDEVVATASEAIRATTLAYNGKSYVKSEGHRGKKATQVAKMLEQLMSQPGVPIEFEELCENAGAKYPADVQAAVMALEMTELIDMYKHSTEPKKVFYVWTEDEE